MTVLVKHDSSDYRLYLNDGTQLGSSRSEMPNRVVMAEMLEEEYSGNSMLANSSPRQVYTEIVTGNYVVVDKSSGELAPWEDGYGEL